MAKSATSRAKTSKKSTKKTVSGSKTTNILSKVPGFSVSRDFTASALLAEFFGTMLLVSVMLITSGQQLYIGLSLIIIAAMFMAVSGSNFNPAISFGLWVARKMSGTRMLAYWVAQFLGALAALIVLNLFASNLVGVDLSSFLSLDWTILALEAIGMAVFMFAFMAAITHHETVMAKSATIGLGLFLGLLVATGYLAQAAQPTTSRLMQQAQGGQTETSRIDKVSATALNPAAALVLTEDKQAQQNPLSQQGAQSTDTTAPSRLTLETIVGPLLGAAVAAYIFRLINENR